LHLFQDLKLDGASKVVKIDPVEGKDKGRFMFRVIAGTKKGEAFRGMVSAPRYHPWLDDAGHWLRLQPPPHRLRPRIYLDFTQTVVACSHLFESTAG